MKKNDFIKKVRETIVAHRMLENKDRVLVAVSGGPDSVALLLALMELREEYNLNLYVAHLNHKLRGKESDEDEKFVKKLAKDLKLRFYSESVNVREKAKEKKLSLEECARMIRYEYLNQTAKKVKATKIALGHNANDQAETVLMRFLRGSGASGLSGMPVYDRKLIRPLINIKREEIESFLRKKKTGYRTDSSNLFTNHLRNKLRLKLLPQLEKEYNPRIIDVLRRTATILSAQQSYLTCETERILEELCIKRTRGKIILDLQEFINYDKCLQREILKECIRKVKGNLRELSYDPLDRILSLIEAKRYGRKVKLVSNVWVEFSSQTLTIYQEEKRKKYQTSFSFPGVKRVKRLGLKIESVVLSNWSSPPQNGFKDQSARSGRLAFVDIDKLKTPLGLRSWALGDKFKPLGMKGTKSVADFLIDIKLPRCERDKVLVLTSEGKIAWVVGLRISDYFRITKKTKNILKLEVNETG